MPGPPQHYRLRRRKNEAARLREVIRRRSAELAVERATEGNPEVLAARATACAFAEFVMVDDAGLPIELGLHQRLMLEHIEDAHARGMNAGLLAPYGHGKTACVVAYILKRIGMDPNIRVQIISRVDTIAHDRLSAVRAYLEDSERYRMLYPGIVPDPNQWGRQAIRVHRDSRAIDPTGKGLGVLAASVGSRTDLQVYEDPIDVRAISPADRSAVSEQVFNTHLQRIESMHGLAIYSGTVYHEQDLAHELLDAAGWCWFVCTVAKDQSGLRAVRFENRRAA